MDANNKIGRVILRTLPLPGNISEVVSGTYTYSGRVLLTYREAGDGEIFYRLATLDDDGANFHAIFAGDVPIVTDANGIRFMCFSDNKRIHLGNFILECTPSLDECETSLLVPVRFPPMKDISGQAVPWSEIIVSPDGKHMAWTALTRQNGMQNLLARLKRENDCYSLENLRIISTQEMWVPDEEHAGCVKPGIMRGGETKQFVRGGAAISEVGACAQTRIADSVVQALDSKDIVQITHTPCYEETTIFSPDEQLGIVMSTRFSPRTNCAVFALVPRPHMLASLSDLTLPIYMYSVASVRKYGKGNIGPALIEIERSMNEDGYLGTNLADPEGNWFYCSPMSWHPSSKRAMWNECSRGHAALRIRIAELPDYVPGTPVAPVHVPDDIPYAKPTDVVSPDSAVVFDSFRVAGRVGGVFESVSEDGWRVYRYNEYTDDGETFINGYERVRREQGGCVYEAKLDVTGGADGEMDMRVRFAQENPWLTADIDFTLDDDGLPQSRGFARWAENRLNVESMLCMHGEE